MRQRLRIYYGPESESATVLEDTQFRRDTVTIPLGEAFPALLDAVENSRSWPMDFEDDEITISTDLYEVLLAYQHYRRPSA